MKLLASLTSPYARKVRIAIAEKKIEYELVEISPWVAGTSVPDYNPLGKVPVLILDDGTALYDSRVIVEYLDTVSPVSRLIPEPSRQRIAVKRWEALADGIIKRGGGYRRQAKGPRSKKRGIAGTPAVEGRSRPVEFVNELGDRPWCCGEAYTLWTSRPAAHSRISTCATRGRLAR
jgi:glutathione S-transferase